jgi:hypothetical protein
MMRLVPIMHKLEPIVSATRVRIGHDLVSTEIDMALELFLLQRTG